MSRDLILFIIGWIMIVGSFVFILLLAGGVI